MFLYSLPSGAVVYFRKRILVIMAVPNKVPLFYFSHSSGIKHMTHALRRVKSARLSSSFLIADLIRYNGADSVQHWRYYYMIQFIAHAHYIKHLYRLMELNPYSSSNISSAYISFSHIWGDMYEWCFRLRAETEPLHSFARRFAIFGVFERYVITYALHHHAKPADWTAESSFTFPLTIFKRIKSLFYFKKLKEAEIKYISKYTSKYI